MGYKICLSTPGLNVFCQELLFKRGYKWANGKSRALFAEEGQYLYLDRNRMTRTSLEDSIYFDEQVHKEITLEDIAKWPEVE